MPDLEQRIDELYGAPLAAFTNERTRLAADLKAEGDDAGAARMKGLKKPVVSAWALNRLTRRDPSALEALEATGRRLREAQERAIADGDAEPLRAATQERHATVSRLTTAVLRLLEEEGVTGGSHADDISSTLDAAAVDPEAFAALRSGRLTRPLRPPTGFGEAAALKVIPGARRKEPEPEAPADPRARRAEVAALRRKVGAAEAQGRKAEQAVEKARARLEAAERERSSAKDALREAEALARGASLELKRAALELRKADPDAED
jgi:hypothetical protein